MPSLIIAADLTALRRAASDIGGSGGATTPGSTGADLLGHAEGDAAVSDFRSAMARHTGTIAGHAAEGAAAMNGYFVAFHEAGD